MQTSAGVLPWLAGLSALCLTVGVIWGFFFTPDDFRQGSTVKIIYLHVPAAMMAINAWIMMLVTSLIWLIRRHHVSALAAKAAGPVGLTMPPCLPPARSTNWLMRSLSTVHSG